MTINKKHHDRDGRDLVQSFDKHQNDKKYNSKLHKDAKIVRLQNDYVRTEDNSVGAKTVIQPAWSNLDYAIPEDTSN